MSQCNVARVRLLATLICSTLFLARFLLSPLLSFQIHFHPPFAPFPFAIVSFHFISFLFGASVCVCVCLCVDFIFIFLFDISSADPLCVRAYTLTFTLFLSWSLYWVYCRIRLCSSIYSPNEHSFKIQIYVYYVQP